MPENIYKIVLIDEHSVTPKYRQVINAILKAIEEGRLGLDYILPSINDLSYELDISRDTGVRAYKELKNLGIIQSIPGKGYYIANTAIKKRLKIFLLFNKLSTHKKIIYDAFAASMNDCAAIDFYIYNNDFGLFRELLINKREDYSNYVIIPHFMEGGEHAHEIINSIPKDKLVMLDKLDPSVEGQYAAVYEDFESDIYAALQQALERLKKYHTLKIIFPAYTYHPKEILNGFHRFCHQFSFCFEVVADIAEETIRDGTVYISLMENDLVLLIEKIIDSGMTVGTQVGVISYNETPLKKIILKGITTISTDFQLMGEKAAELIKNKSVDHIAIPFYLTLRDSL